MDLLPCSKPHAGDSASTTSVSRVLTHSSWIVREDFTWCARPPRGKIQAFPFFEESPVNFQGPFKENVGNNQELTGVNVDFLDFSVKNMGFHLSHIIKALRRVQKNTIKIHQFQGHPCFQNKTSAEDPNPNYQWLNWHQLLPSLKLTACTWK